MQEIKTRRHRGGLHSCKPLVGYDSEGKRYTFESITHLSNVIKVCAKTIGIHLNRSGMFQANGFTYYYKKDDPKRTSTPRQDGISPQDDLPCIMFDRYGTHQNLGEFSSVTKLAKVLSRNVTDVLGWVKGTKRCTDLDCYYKYAKDCTTEEINNCYIIKK